MSCGDWKPLPGWTWSDAHGWRPPLPICQFCGQHFWGEHRCKQLAEMFVMRTSPEPVSATNNNVAEKDLKPCPFCGGKAEYERMGSAKQSCIISCVECGCSLETGEVWTCGQQWNRRR